jgi:hypothetical protein
MLPQHSSRFPTTILPVRSLNLIALILASTAQGYIEERKYVKVLSSVSAGSHLK